MEACVYAGSDRGSVMALEPIRVLEFADADRADVQRRVVDAVQAAPERFLTDYAARPGTFGGRYVCADAMKELLPEYTASREARGRYNAPVHNAAAVLAAEQYRRVEIGRASCRERVCQYV